MKNLKQTLRDRESREAYENELHNLLRHGEVSKIERLISQGFELYPSAFSAICKDIKPATIQFYGWNELIADIVEFEATEHHRIKPEDRKITALGIDITGSDSEHPEPEIEVSFYNDSTYPFSKKTRDEISSDYPTETRPWEDGFMECTYSLQLVGFRRIIEEFSKLYKRNGHQYTNLSNDYLGKFLAEWFVYLRLYQALKRQLEQVGLHSSIPVILSQNEFGSHFGVVFECRKIADHQSRTIEILRERATLRAKRSMAQLQQNVDLLRSNREFVKSLPKRLFRNRVQKVTGESIIKSFQITMDTHNLTIPKPLDKMTDKQFEKAISVYKENWLRSLHSN